MHHTKGFALRSALLMGLMAVASAAPVMAQQTQGASLGQAWPNTADVSASPRWHVYKFVQDGVQYLQINDLAGNVQAAIATANGTMMVLPMGASSSVVSTPQIRKRFAATSGSPETIYSDGKITITTTPQGATSKPTFRAALCDKETCGNMQAI